MVKVYGISALHLGGLYRFKLSGSQGWLRLGGVGFMPGFLWVYRVYRASVSFYAVLYGFIGLLSYATKN